MGWLSVGERTVDNLYTGLKLTTSGKAAVTLGAGVATGYSLLKNQNIKNNIFSQDPLRHAEKTPGVHQPISMGYDGRNTPSMGADGSLTLALSKLR
ncbi:MAG: hypothetical protein ACOCUT_02515 [bacterium]